MVSTLCACKATDNFFYFQSSQKTFPQKQIHTTIFHFATEERFEFDTSTWFKLLKGDGGAVA